MSHKALKDQYHINLESYVLIFQSVKYNELFIVKIIIHNIFTIQVSNRDRDRNI